MTWSVYIIQASDQSYYTGVTTDIERRFKEHLSGGHGAKYFQGRAPLGVVYLESGHTRSSACKREAEIKKLRHGQKDLLVKAHPTVRTHHGPQPQRETGP